MDQAKLEGKKKTMKKSKLSIVQLKCFPHLISASLALVFCISAPSGAEPLGVATVLTINSWEATCWHSKWNNKSCRISKNFSREGRIQIDFKKNKVEIAQSQCSDEKKRWTLDTVSRSSEKHSLRKISEIVLSWTVKCGFDNNYGVEDIENVSWIMLQVTR